ncbi:hypothetical protein BY996DRAFT_6663967 [Phakopsora pachyrhizi]|nr:hypothetical protein BY996DRAFT_6663967 [Phakopsora pachyrhizi]
MVEEELVTFLETDGVSSEESSPACSTEELVHACQPGVSHLIGKISLALTTPATSLLLVLPNSSINVHFESQPIVSVTPAPKATVDCAMALLFAPPTPVMVSSMCLFPWQLPIGSCRSLSVVNFGRLGTGGSSSVCAFHLTKTLKVPDLFKSQLLIFQNNCLK